jgi:nucleoside-diphosphate-sugar epimerase
MFEARYDGLRVCVTGGAGFIGGHLCERLLELGAQVTLLDDLSNSDGVFASGLVEGHPGRARLVYGSLLDPEALAQAMNGAGVVFHLAALNSVPRSIAEPERAFEVNAIGTLRVAQAARSAGAGRLVYAASSSAYGDDPALPKSEVMLPRPVSPYGASKLAGEVIVSTWARCYGLPGISLRFFNVFGPRQPVDGPYAAVMPAFMRALLAGRSPVIYGDGSASRDFTPVADVVSALLRAGSVAGVADGRVLNVGRGSRITVAELARTMARLSGVAGAEPQFQPAREGDVPHSEADVSLARASLGYEPSADLEPALQQTVQWFREFLSARDALDEAGALV